MKAINLFIQTKNNLLTDASAKAINYFLSIKEQFNDHSINVYHFVHQSNQANQLVEISALYNYFTIEYSDDNLLGDSVELDVVFQNLVPSDAAKFIFAKSTLLDKLAAQISNQFSIPLVSNVIEIKNNHFVKEIFSGKAKADLSCENSSWVVILAKSISSSTIINYKEQSFKKIVLNQKSTYQIIKVNKITNSIPLPDAQIVVGAGRGLKDPSNWEMIENLAIKLGAATACSKPVSDLNWRPHHEHVGQTGVKISPKLYIACGISGAIQHLAGVNNSGKIVVINNDPEAPFFKNADYGIVGDVFDIIPRLLKKLN